MATWYARATDTPEETPPSLFDKFWGKVTGAWKWVVRILILLFLSWLFFTVMGLLSSEVREKDTHATYSSIEAEDNDAVISQADKRLWSYLMNFASSLNYLEGKEYSLGSEKSREFGEAYFQSSDAIFVKEVKFYNNQSNQRTAEITYEMGVNKEIHLTYQNNHIKKEMTRHEGFSEAGSFFRYVLWYTYGRFMKGYPCYTCDVAMENGVELGSRTLTKETIHLEPFSKIMWAFRQLKNTNNTQTNGSTAS